ncbi:MAG: zf-HC2 domain-containing protein [Ignavibacteriaceae bacterium]
MSKDVKNMELLSAYLDGELSRSEKAEVENLLQNSLELKMQLEDLKKIKQLTQNVKRIPESPYFETRLMSKIEGQKSESAKISRWMPATALALVTIAVMIVLKINPELVNQLWDQQKEAITGFYKENLQPVLFAANLTNEDIFNFAFNNEIPLDNSRKQYLLLGYDDSGKEFFEIRSGDEKMRRQSYNEFISAMNLNEKQRESVDSIIGSYGEALESQVLVNDKNTVAINPNLWNYRKAIFADLLVAAEKLNIKGFNRIVPAGISDAEKVRVVNAMQNLKTSPEGQYIFVTPDSVFADSYQFDSKLYIKELKKLEKELIAKEEEIKQFTLSIRFDSTLKYAGIDNKLQHSFRITVDSNICRVDIPENHITELQLPDIESINPLIEQATKNIHFYAYKIPKVERSSSRIKIEYYDNDSVHSYEMNFGTLNMDSLAGLKPDFDLYSLDHFKQVKPFDDSMLAKYQFDKDYFDRYYSDDNFKKQMEELQKELERLSEETKDWKIKVHKEVTKSPRK